MKVLIVDDSRFMRAALRRIFEEEGWNVVEADNGEDAIRMYDSEKPDIMTLDIVMPGMNGIEVLKRLMKKHPSAKVLVVSALSQPKMIHDAINSGAIDFIAKPFRKEDVIESLRYVIQPMKGSL